MRRGIFNFFSGSVAYTEFDYGNLATKYPAETYSQLKTRRQSNFNLLKTEVQAGRPVYFAPERLEIDIPTGDTIQNTNVRLYGASKSLSNLFIYPIPPVQALHKLFTPTYGDTYNLSNFTIKSQEKNYLFETYPCILKNGGVQNCIKILGSVRSGFWADMVVGKSVFYAWSRSVVGETKVIQSIDEPNALIYLTTNISGSVSNDTQGVDVNFGTTFKEEISMTDYTTYGQAWQTNFNYLSFVYGIPVSSIGVDATFNLTNVGFENAFQPFTISMGSGKVNMYGAVHTKQNAVGFSYFSREVAGGQTVTIDSAATFTVEENGDYIAGSIQGLQPSGNYGSGVYLHDNIIVKCNGTIHLKNNTSASWRQYSSNYSPVGVGDFSYYKTIIAEGSQEYDFLGSNTMPTVVDSLTSSGQFLMRHDVTINGGESTGLVSSQGLDFGLGNRTVTFNNFSLNGRATLALYNSTNFNNCVFHIKASPTQDVKISCGVNNTFTDCQLLADGVGTWNTSDRTTSGDIGEVLLDNGGINGASITIDNLVWGGYFYHSFARLATCQTHYIEISRPISIQNTDIKAYTCFTDNLYSTAGTVSNVVSGTNTVIRGRINNIACRGPKMNVSGLAGTKSASIVASKTYSQAGLLTNVLEVDFLHDVYEITGGGTINAIMVSPSGWDVGMAVAYGRNITIRAIGSPVTVTTWNSSSNPTSNILTNGFTISAGGEQVFTINRGKTLFTSSSVETPTIATGNGSTKIYKGALGVTFDPDTLINITAGSVNVNANSEGVISHADLVGIVDPWSGKYELRFTNNVPNSTPIVLTYNSITWRNTGAWVAN